MIIPDIEVLVHDGGGNILVDSMQRNIELSLLTNPNHTYLKVPKPMGYDLTNSLISFDPIIEQIQVYNENKGGHNFAFYAAIGQSQ